jgi:hypothetical protein
MITAVNGAGKVGVVATALIVAAAIALGVRQFTASGGQANPCAGLTDAECQELITEARDEFQKNYAAWFEDFQTKRVDVRTLPRSPLMASYEASQPDLAAAIGVAELVVVATVNAVEFTPQWTVVSRGLNKPSRANQAAG